MYKMEYTVKNVSTFGIYFARLFLQKNLFAGAVWFVRVCCQMREVSCSIVRLPAFLSSFSFFKYFPVMWEAEWEKMGHRIFSNVSEQASQGTWLIIRENGGRKTDCTWERGKKKMSCSAQWLLLHLLIESLCPFFIYYCQLKSRFDIYNSLLNSVRLFVGKRASLQG